MTLHWWMHWFWVTLLLSAFLCSSSTAAPQSEELQHITTDTGAERHGDRQGRAMYYTKTVTYSTKPTPLNVTETPDNYTNKNNTNITKEAELLNDSVTNNDTSIFNDSIVHPAVQWTPINISELNISTSTPKVLLNLTTPSPIANVTSDTPNTTIRRKNLTRPDLVKDDSSIEGAPESRIVTEKPLSLETSLLQTRVPPNIEPSRRIIDSGGSGMDTGVIAGISFAALVLAALAGSTAFVLYRRRYLNKPQTLNDKCSNPDSSGYLDDSTIRDNSEEMYSLDNDSFLNSLEAMTIQNYWTDTVKHTKL